MILRIKEIAKLQGLTQKALAEKVGISTYGLSKAINGNPTIKTLEKIADVLGVKVWDLLQDADCRKKNINVFDDLIRLNDSEETKHTPREIRKMYNIYAKLIAANVRNNIEDFHCKYLSDAQMKALNPLIRDAIYTAMVNMTEKPEYIEHYWRYVPPYWEDCEMTTSKSYTKNRFTK